ncbi:MAG: nicotinate (nicotinamide) nucleotide adenylyltransferase [Erysipelotrichales bacterium]|nr:nicotinate (nicotinamide) nucleotide adenylyltransferase [Erysipelotrichales bacterium]
MKKILIYGGSFDPIHNGHIKVAKKVKTALGIDKVVFELAKAPRWKTPLVESKHRLNMLKMALMPYKDFEYDLFEYNSKDEINYSYNTALYFKELYPNDELYMLIGYDQVNKLHDWYEIDKLSKLVHIVAYNRKGEEVSVDNISKYNVTIVKGPLYSTSSTSVRNFKSIDIDNNVLSYILNNQLYFASKVKNYMSIKRYAHSVEVAMLALIIAKNNKINKLSTFKAALLHDIGKEVDAKSNDDIMHKHFEEYCDLPKFANHQFVGAHLAKRDFKINSKDILEAIKYHATGNANMNKIGMIVYTSDKIEPTRGFDSSDLIKEVVENLETGFVKVLAANKEYLLEHHGDIHNRLTDACMRQYLDIK